MIRARSVRRPIRRRGQSGQTATEFMMVISVVVIAAVGATQFLLSSNGPWAEGFRNFNGRLNQQIQRGYVCDGSAQCRG